MQNEYLAYIQLMVSTDGVPLENGMHGHMTTTLVVGSVTILEQLILFGAEDYPNFKEAIKLAAQKL